MSGRVPYSVYKTLPAAAKKALVAANYKRKSYPRKVYGRGAYTAGTRYYTRQKNYKPAYSGMSKYAYSALGKVAKYAAPAAAVALGYKYNDAIATTANMLARGFGDYSMSSIKPKSNSLMEAITVNGPPILQSTYQRSFVMRHREYLGDVITGPDAGFNITDFPINPGLSETFPWLSTIAQNFEQYKVKGMIFEFKSTSADALNSTNTALGTVIMATEYNSDSTPFLTKQQMENHEFASSCKQSCSMLHPVECKPSLTSITELYTRTSAVPSGQDLRLYDLGRFSIATVGQQGSEVNIGELWVTYEIELLKPQLPDIPSGVGSDHITASSAITTSNYFGTNTNYISNTVGCTVDSDTIYFPDNIASGEYLLCLYWRGIGVPAAVTIPSLTFANCTGVNATWENSTANFVTNSTTTAPSLFLLQNVVIQALGATIKLSGGTLPISPSGMDCVITRISTLS